MNTAAVILAAGKGTRMKSDLPKVAHTVLEKPMVNWVIEAAQEAGISRIVTVVGHGKEIVTPLVEGKTDIAVQANMLGTADAVLAAADACADFEGPLVILSGDCPLITPQTIQALLMRQEQTGAACVVLTMNMDDPFGYGRIVRDTDGSVLRIVEQKDASEEEAAITECNSGFYCFDAKTLFASLAYVNNNNAQGELYLTDVLEIARNAGKRVEALVVDDPTECLGVNTPEQLAVAADCMQKRLQQAQ